LNKILDNKVDKFEIQSLTHGNQFELESKIQAIAGDRGEVERRFADVEKMV